MSVTTGNTWNLKYGAVVSSGSQNPTSSAQNVQDVTVTMGGTMAETTCRGDSAKTYIPGVKEVSIEVTILNDSSDGFYTAVHSAYVGGTPIAINAGPVTGAFHVADFSNPQPLDEAVTNTITFQPAHGYILTFNA